MRYLVVLLLAGCATTEHVWDKPGASEQDWHMDRGACNAQAASHAPLGSVQWAVIFGSCMNGKGWQRIERPV